jgi:hypothetical protein
MIASWTWEMTKLLVDPQSLDGSWGHFPTSDRRLPLLVASHAAPL